MVDTKYDDDVGEVRQYLVSSSGQMSLPAAARHRWNLDDGGPVDVVDLGFGVLTLPRGEGRRLSALGAEAAAAAEHVGAPLCVSANDDGPRIRAAVAAAGGDYRTISR